MNSYIEVLNFSLPIRQLTKWFKETNINGKTRAIIFLYKQNQMQFDFTNLQVLSQKQNALRQIFSIYVALALALNT